MSSPWDFDSNYMIGADAWSVQHNNQRAYIKMLFQHKDFYDYYKELWQNISNNLINCISEVFQNFENTQASSINLAREYDAARWNKKYNTVEYELDSAMQWFEGRTKWLDSHILTKVWAYNKTIYIQYPINTKYEIINLNGQLIARSETKTDIEQIPLSSAGIYLVRINEKEVFKIPVN